MSDRTFNLRMAGVMLRITHAQSADDLAMVRVLLQEYQAEQEIDLCFQGFAAELRDLPGAYAAPCGRLLLASTHDATIGCVALRDVGDGRGEMKRLFVRPAGRGTGAGAALVMRLLDEARAAGYVEVVLDTLPSMQTAQRLYERLGFIDIAPYRDNPVPGARYLGLSLITH